ncbi:MAG: thioredoxin family protein [Alphaproteobacteria bacterium]
MRVKAAHVFVFACAAVLAALAFQVTPSPAEETRFKPYAADSFAAAQDAGKTILVDVFATWCPTCKRQEPILARLAADPALSDVMLFRVNWDKDKDFVREHRIPRQSTILVFKGDTEAGRSVAETRETELRRFVLDAIAEPASVD